MKPVDRIGFRDWRSWATRGVRGLVLEIGAGTGLNFAHYAEGVRVIALEPDREMLSESDPAESPAHISLVQGSAEEIPFPDESFDVVLGTLVFCTIPLPERALREVWRVLKPGGTFRLVEHVKSLNPVLGAVMDLATPIWKQVAGGCHLNRNTEAAVRAAGFEIVRVQKRWAGLLVGIDARKTAQEVETGGS